MSARQPLAAAMLALSKGKAELEPMTIAQASADIHIPAAVCLAEPPRDVGRLLEHYGAALPQYLDAHRWREIENSRQRWPLLRTARTKA